jgi:hypothetical protein
MDGNRRFARALGLDPRAGHDFGASKARDVLRWCLDLGIGHVTLWGFSTDNRARPAEEVAHLHRLFAAHAREFMSDDELRRHRVRVRVIGDIADFPDDARLYRHRGHRYITLRQFDAAIADLTKAASLIEGKPDEVEPDGQPNAANIPVSTLGFNIWYHLGLAHFVKGDWEAAAAAFTRCLDFSGNDDARVSTYDWLFMSLRRAGRDTEADQLLWKVRPTMTIDLGLLILTAASIGFVHTLLGPDHYLPFVAMSAARRWAGRPPVPSWSWWWPEAARPDSSGRPRLSSINTRSPRVWCGRRFAKTPERPAARRAREP